MNERRFEHTSRNGTKFIAKRCDFTGGVCVLNQPSLEMLRMQDLSEMVAYHIFNIYPELNGFSGYDAIRFL